LTLGPGIELTRYNLVTFAVSGRGFVWSDDDSNWIGSALGDDLGVLALGGDFTDDDSGESMQANVAVGPGLPSSPVIFFDCGLALAGAPCFYPYETRLMEDAAHPIPEPDGAILFGIGILPVALTVSKRRSRARGCADASADMNCDGEVEALDFERFAATSAEPKRSDLGHADALGPIPPCAPPR
jgi:hypothetical protein